MRIGGSPLAVHLVEMPPYLVGQWIGAGVDGAREVALEASAELISRRAERVILDLSRFAEAADSVNTVLARCITEAQRLGRTVYLVRCPDEVFRGIQRAGLAGTVHQVSSLLAATQGMAGEPASSVEMHLTSTPEMLSRVRSVISVMAERARLADFVTYQVKTAVTEAAANAIVHGSPEGSRNQVRLCFHVDPNTLIVDIADQGPGFEPGSVPPPELGELPEHGYGIHMMRQIMDRVEFYRDERGMLVRLTKYLNGEARQ